MHIYITSSHWFAHRGRLPSFEELLKLAYGSDMPATESDPLRQARAHVRVVLCLGLEEGTRHRECLGRITLTLIPYQLNVTRPYLINTHIHIVGPRGVLDASVLP